MKKIIFIFHEATITGAPILLFRFLKYLHGNNPGWDIKLLFQKSGPLLHEAEKLFPVTVMNIDPGVSFPQRLNTWLKKRNNKRKLKSLFKSGVSLVYSNTIANGLLLNEIRSITHAKVLLHVHELPLIIHQFGKANHEFNQKYADAIIFNSKMTADAWTNERSDLTTTIVYPFIDDSETGNSINNSQTGGFVIGGCGNFTWRKGIESFIFVAKEINEQRKDVRFKWVGGDHASIEFTRWKHLINLLGLDENFDFIASTQNASPVFETFSLLFVSSYEEPFSMVAAECASLGIPLACYENCTGAAELFIPEAGIAVPPGLHHESASLMIRLLDDESGRLKMGVAAKKIAAANTDWKTNSMQMIDFIDKVMKD